jgi:hypothetical protein
VPRVAEGVARGVIEPFDWTDGGSILICDHVNFSSPSGHRADHFMTVEEHLPTFEEVGFIKAREIGPAADRSLMAAEKP